MSTRRKLESQALVGGGIREFGDMGAGVFEGGRPLNLESFANRGKSKL